MNGHLNILKWVINSGREYDEYSCVIGAVRRGKLEILKWFTEKGLQPCCVDDLNVMSSSLCVHAARSGQLATLKWLMENGCPFVQSVFYYAIYGDHIHILKYLRESGYTWDNNMCKKATGSFRVKNDKVDMRTLKWLIEAGCPWGNAPSYGFDVIGDKAGEMERWCRERGCRWFVFD